MNRFEVRYLTSPLFCFCVCFFLFFSFLCFAWGENILFPKGYVLTVSLLMFLLLFFSFSFLWLHQACWLIVYYCSFSSFFFVPYRVSIFLIGNLFIHRLRALLSCGFCLLTCYFIESLYFRFHHIDVQLVMNIWIIFGLAETKARNIDILKQYRKMHLLFIIYYLTSRLPILNGNNK